MRVDRKRSLIPIERVKETIFFIRGQKVILDADLARLYGTTTKRLNEQVKRNRERFPEDFMFQLTKEEKAEVVANCDHLSTLKYSPALPRAFTEHGAIMAATVLNTQRAIEASIFIVRAFVALREMVATQKELARKLSDLEQHLKDHDQQIQAIFEAIRQLMSPPERSRKKIGFEVKESAAAYRKRAKKKTA
ncbi:MAG: ORF6N domain-containing protein [Deltaproteobacteria bacterium]|nr:ORF6N domain-containing protein [Deltaproteobacteria bacterium]